MYIAIRKIPSFRYLFVPIELLNLNLNNQANQPRAVLTHYRMKVSNEGEEWFPLFREGDTNAFRQVFEKYYRAILYFASSILQEDSYAEDIASETFRKAWDNRGKFETIKHLENSLFLVTRNACISYLRSNRVAHSTVEEWTNLAADLEEPGTSIDVKRFQAQLIDKLYNHLSTLSGGDVLRMSYLEGKSTQEIAEKLGITENNVYIIKSRSLRQLRTLLKKDALSLLFLLFFRDLF